MRSLADFLRVSHCYLSCNPEKGHGGYFYANFTDSQIRLEKQREKETNRIKQVWGLADFLRASHCYLQGNPEKGHGGYFYYNFTYSQIRLEIQREREKNVYLDAGFRPIF